MFCTLELWAYIFCFEVSFLQFHCVCRLRQSVAHFTGVACLVFRYSHRYSLRASHISLQKFWEMCKEISAIVRQYFAVSRFSDLLEGPFRLVMPCVITNFVILSLLIIIIISGYIKLPYTWLYTRSFYLMNMTFLRISILHVGDVSLSEFKNNSGLKILYAICEGLLRIFKN
jgi:hypothetical protein